MSDPKKCSLCGYRWRREGKKIVEGKESRFYGMTADFCCHPEFEGDRKVIVLLSSCPME